MIDAAETRSELHADQWSPASAPIPEHWVYAGFEEAFENLSLTGLKIPQKDYLESGRYPVVDQGADLIGGYTDEADKVLDAGRPVIVFGDHTKCFKYVQLPFVPGADGVKVLVPRGGISERYAFYACQSLRLPDRGYSRHYSFLKKSRVPLPPVNEQRRIVAKIEALFSELDKGIEALKTAREQLKVYRQAVLKHAFEGKLTARWREENPDKVGFGMQVDGAGPGRGNRIPDDELASLPDLPGGWIYMRFGDFISAIEAGKSFKCDERRPGPGEVGVAKVSAVTWGEYDEEESKTCVDLSRVNPSYFISSGDFLISRANTIGLVGACVVVRRVTQNVMLSDKTLRVKFRSGNKEFFLNYLRSQQGRREIMKRSTGNQESMRNIGQDRIKSIVVPCCSPEEAAVVVSEVERRLENVKVLTTAIDTELARADMLRQSILKKAFSGQLVPQDPNDEPAAVLLERVRAEKAAQAKPAKSSRRKQPA